MILWVYKMKEYEILKNRDNAKAYICFMNTVEDVEYYLNNIKSDMQKIGCNKILIDLFLSNGLSYNRFFEYNLENEKNLLLVNPRNIDRETYELIDNYIGNNLELLENSALSNAFKKMFLNHIKVIKKKDNT